MKKTCLLLPFLLLVIIDIFPVYAHTEELIIVSDSEVQWSSDGVNWFSAVECWIDPRWPMIVDSSWIWRTEVTDAAWEYNNLPEGGWYFRRIFSSDNVPELASIQISADNAYQVWLNDVYIGGDGPMHRDGPEHQEWKDIETHDVTNHVLIGENVVLIRALNCWESENPAGLIFKITMIYTPDFIIPEFPRGTIAAFSACIISLLMLLFLRMRKC